MDPDNGRLYESEQDAKNNGVKEPLIVLGEELVIKGEAAETFVLAATNNIYANNRAGRRQALKDQRRAYRRG